MDEYTLKSGSKRKSILSKAEIMFIFIIFSWFKLRSLNNEVFTNI